jgi:hypothetical protein
MRIKTIRVTILCFAPVLLVACGTLLPSSYQDRSLNAENRLADMMQQLPTPSGATLVEQVTTATSGQMPECEGREIYALFGTNELSLQEVLDFYTSAMQDAQWHLNRATNNDRNFSKGDEFLLDISDIEISKIGRDAVNKAKSKFSTIYLLYLFTPLETPFPSQCKGG